jgi:hypothetical protein
MLTSFVILIVAMQLLPLRHTLDVMHVEKNVSANILGHVVGEKDIVSMRHDMVHANFHPN